MVLHPPRSALVLTENPILKEKQGGKFFPQKGGGGGGGGIFFRGGRFFFFSPYYRGAGKVLFGKILKFMSLNSSGTSTEKAAVPAALSA